jgi:hypothetical protein
MNISVGTGVGIREFPMLTAEADYPSEEQAPAKGDLERDEPRGPVEIVHV